MFAVIEMGGKQYLVREKDVLRVERLELEESKSGVCDKVLLTATDTDTKIGTAYVTGAKVSYKVLKNGLGDKVRSFKMKAKKRYKRLKGHRQAFSEIQITKIA